MRSPGRDDRRLFHRRLAGSILFAPSPGVPAAHWGSPTGWPARRGAPAFERWLSPAQMDSETPASLATRPHGPHEPAARKPRAAEGSGAWLDGSIRPVVPPYRRW